ncbi:hypothetical protein [Actinomadura keratinilytica]|uniref:Tetratricopeptide repeat protein n=1 Tax=Actinomadura keratinilytica TaxID=547461 RepID=A0ABP7Z857_9ACTN
MGTGGDMWSDPLQQYEDELELAGRLRRRLDAALTECPACYATVMAMFDWWQAAGTSVPADRLYPQAARRMAALRPHPALTREEFAEALEEACAEPALLVPDGPGRYALADQVGRVLLPALPTADEGAERLAGATPLEAVAIGKAAWFTRHGDPELARRAWRQAAHSDDADAAAVARWYLAEAVLEDGDVPAARAALERILREDHFATAPRAMLALADLCREQAPDRARALLEKAVAAGHREVTARAAHKLAGLRERLGDEPGVIEAMRIAFEWGDALSAPYDGLALAALLRRAGETGEAERVLKRIIAWDSPFHTADAVVELSVLFALRGELAESERLLTTAIEREYLFAPRLKLQLARVRLARGDEEAARALLDEARRHPVGLQPQDVAQAHVLEAQFAISRGDDDEAAQLFAEVLRSPDPVTRQSAHLIAVAIGDGMRPGGPWAIPGVEPLMRHLMNEAASPTREWAAYCAGLIAEQAGEAEAAVSAYLGALVGRAPRYAVLAAAKLAALAESTTELERYVNACVGVFEDESAAEVAEEGVAEAVVPAARFLRRLGRDDLVERVRDACLGHVQRGGPHAARIAFNLGVLAGEVCGDGPSALALWELAAELGDADVASRAWYEAGIVHSQRFSAVSAAQAFRRVIDIGHPEHAPRAALVLGGLAGRFLDMRAALDAYEAALEADDPAVAAEAAFHLGCLVQPPEDAEDALHRVIASDAASPELVGAAYAHLGRVYASSGNRRLAQRYWRKGRNHPDPAVAAAFAAARKAIGRVASPRRRRR